jgi:hypothetical protein
MNIARLLNQEQEGALRIESLRRIFYRMAVAATDASNE